MEPKLEQRLVLKFFVKEGLTPIQCWRCLNPVFQEATYSKKQIRVWHQQFTAGREDTKDRKCPGRPHSVTTPKNVTKVSDILEQDKCLTVREISDESGIKKSSVHKMMKHDLKLSKLAPKFVPKLLNDEQKRARRE